MTNLDSILKSRHYLAYRGPSSQSYGFSSSHVWMWELDHKEGLALKNWCFWTMVLEKALESPLNCKEIKRINPKEICPEYSLEGSMLKLKLQNTGHLMWGAYSLEKTLMLGNIEGRRRRGRQRIRLVGWHQRPNKHEFEQTPGDGEGQGSLEFFSPWGCKELDTTE